MDLKNVRQAPMSFKDFAYEGLRLAEDNDEEAIRSMKEHDDAALGLECERLKRSARRFRLATIPICLGLTLLFGAVLRVFSDGAYLPQAQLAVMDAAIISIGAIAVVWAAKREKVEASIRRRGQMNDLYILAMRLRTKMDEASILGSEVRLAVKPPPVPKS